MSLETVQVKKESEWDGDDEARLNTNNEENNETTEPQLENKDQVKYDIEAVFVKQEPVCENTEIFGCDQPASKVCDVEVKSELVCEEQQSGSEGLPRGE
ncbi:uncharacterized protein LOC133529414 isoform X2 [Cydia pomonella]|uniref:uncharacterized protein LOC133529414 isoform X2 n=1 Tax=Cydia pomonella TaxID=82600 RepID=UPI002ADE3720|nr:uncharacterized protein LOC133529414 isoform X2 [Cydia pomonella]